VKRASLVFGIETEYGFTPFNAEGSPFDRAAYAQRLVHGAPRRWPAVRGRDWSDVYLGNGARLYTDCGTHPEYATPECTTPEEAVAAIRAGDRILEQLARDLERDTSVSHAFLYRGNVDYSDSRITWGCHESLLHRCSHDVISRNIVAHLVSRIIYAGAGGFDASSPGIVFTLAPRVRFTIRREFVAPNGHQRGFFHTKDESLGGPGLHRLHITCGESLCSERADYLRIGTTALIVALIDAGLDPGKGVQFAEPIGAMHTIASDPTCTRPLRMAGRMPMTAIEVQRHFLQSVERSLSSAFMPPWAPAVCGRWSATLDQLERDPLELSPCLDWPMKRTLYGEYAARAGFSWDRIETLNRLLVPWILARRRQPRRPTAPEGPQTIPSRREGEREMPRASPLPPRNDDLQLGLWPPDSPEATETATALDRHGFTRSTVDEFARLRNRLFEIDTRFSEPGRGIFAGLDRAGGLDHRILDPAHIEHAVSHAPTSSRARQRSRYIRSLARTSDVMCNWTCIAAGNRFLDMSDPFGTTRPRWRDHFPMAHSS
jgi:proteasome accessory factor A